MPDHHLMTSIEVFIIVGIFLVTRYFLVTGQKSEEAFPVSMANFIRENKVSLNGANSIFVPEGRLATPIFYHYIASYLPKLYIKANGLRILNCFFDLITVLFVYIFIEKCTSFEPIKIGVISLAIKNFIMLEKISKGTLL